jgi:tight adherence protein B
MRRRVLLTVAVLALVVPAGATAALRIGEVDSSAFPTMRVTVVTPTPTTKAPTMQENGHRVVVVNAVNFGRAKGIVLAVDRSQSMRGQPLAEAVSAARAFVDVKRSNDEVAVTAFGSGAVHVSRFSTAKSDAYSALSGIAIDSTPGTKLYDDLVASSRGLDARRLPGKVIVVVTDGNETSSRATFRDVITEARKDHVLIFVVAIESKQFTPGPLKKLAAGTGGKYYAAASVASLRQIYSSIASELKRTWRVEYLTASRPGDRVEVTATVPGQGSASETFLIAAAQAQESKSKLPKAAFTTAGTLALAGIVGLLVLLAVGLTLRKSGKEELRRRIQPHIEVEPEKKKRKRERSSAFKTLFRLTEDILGKTKQWAALDRLLERADVPLKTVEFVYIMFVAGIAVGFVTRAFGLGGIFVLVGFVLGALLPVGFIWRKASRRLAAFDEQLADLLMSVAASLKAGHSFKQGIQTLVEDAEDPAKKEFQRVLAETSLGRSVEEALADMADRLGSKNFSFIVTAVTIQNQVGGSLAGLFDMVADTVRSRQMFVRKIRALTAMGRASAYVLLGLPFFLALMLTAVDREYIAPLFTTSTGHALIIVGLIMMSIGAVVLRKIVSFKG